MQMNQPGFIDLSDRYESLSKFGDPLGKINAVVDFEVFRDPIETGLNFSDGSKGGRPPYDTVLMFKILILQALYNLSDGMPVQAWNKWGESPLTPIVYSEV